jgi:hypothetical protein
VRLSEIPKPFSAGGAAENVCQIFFARASNALVVAFAHTRFRGTSPALLPSKVDLLKVNFLFANWFAYFGSYDYERNDHR